MFILLPFSVLYTGKANVLSSSNTSEILSHFNRQKKHPIYIYIYVYHRQNQLTGYGCCLLTLLPTSIMMSLDDRSNSSSLWYHMTFEHLLRSRSVCKAPWSEVVGLILLSWGRVLGKKKSNSDYGRVILEGRWLLRNLKSGGFLVKKWDGKQGVTFWR